MTTVYGIKNCDSVKKSCRWLEQKNIQYEFHDLRIDNITQTKLKQWCDNITWEALLNRRSTTWRKLPDRQKAGINQSTAIKLMTEQPTLIRRPVIEHNNNILVGFSEDLFKQTFL